MSNLYLQTFEQKKISIVSSKPKFVSKVTEKHNTNKRQRKETNKRRLEYDGGVVVVAVGALKTAADFANVQIFESDGVVHPHGGDHGFVVIVDFDFVPLTHVGHWEPSLHVEFDRRPVAVEVLKVEKDGSFRAFRSHQIRNFASCQAVESRDGGNIYYLGQ